MSLHSMHNNLAAADVPPSRGRQVVGLLVISSSLSSPACTVVTERSPFATDGTSAQVIIGSKAMVAARAPLIRHRKATETAMTILQEPLRHRGLCPQASPKHKWRAARRRLPRQQSRQ